MTAKHRAELAATIALLWQAADKLGELQQAVSKDKEYDVEAFSKIYRDISDARLHAVNAAQTPAHLLK